MKTARTARVEYRRLRRLVTDLLAKIKEMAVAKHGTAQGKEVEAMLVAVHKIEGELARCVSKAVDFYPPR